MNVEPEWLPWAREIAAIAQSGLAFAPSFHDRERYERLRTLSASMIASQTAVRFERIAALFGCETGYATPKVDVRGAVFDREMRLLMVRERADADRWSLPGGWADVNLTAAANVIKEVEEESGFRVRVTKLAAVLDRTRQGHTPGIFSCYKLFFLCEVIGGAAAASDETSAVGWFAEDRVPEELSLGRVLPAQIRRLFQHARDAALPTDFE